MGDSSNIKKGINDTINSMQVDSFLSKLDVIQKKSLTQITKEIDLFFFEILSDLDKSNGLDPKNIQSMKNELKEMDHILTKHSKNKPNIAEEENVTFF